MADDKGKKKDRKKSRNWALWTVVGVVVLATAFAITFVIARTGDKKSKTGRPAPAVIASLDKSEAESEDMPLSATTEGEEESEPAEVATTAEDTAFSTEGAEDSEEPPVDESAPSPEEPPASDMVIPLDASTVQWDANERKIRIVSEDLNLEFTEAKQNKLKLKKAQDQLSDLERKLDQSKQTNTSLTMENGDLEDQLKGLKQQIRELESGVPNLDLIKVDKIECFGPVEKKTKNGKVVAVEIPECDVYLSVVSKK